MPTSWDKIGFGKQARTVGLILFFLCAVLIIWTTIIYVELQGQIDGRLKDRVDARMLLCQRVEKLDKARRLDAWRSWNTLPVTLKIIHVKETPAVRRLALDTLHRSLRRFAPIDCVYFSHTSQARTIKAPRSERLEGLPPKKTKVVIHDNG